MLEVIAEKTTEAYDSNFASFNFRNVCLPLALFSKLFGRWYILY